MKSRTLMLVAVATLALPAGAQMETVRRADIRGGGGDRGKCTIEVEVDGVAEVQISGDVGRIRTLGGQPARWRRFECSTMMPRDPNDFRFRGIDGRGRVELVQDPRSRRGMAVVRIEDPKGGSEGYTFDLEWQGGSYTGGDRRNGGDRRFDPNDRRLDPDDRRFDPNDRRGNGDLGGWNRRLTFTGRGDGHYRDARGGTERIYDCQVAISNRGQVQVSFNTDRNFRMSMSGRVVRFDRDRIVADMSGSGIRGEMIIQTDGRDRVRDISMSGSGRDRFELRWRD